ncbi:hypothetical protein [Lysobacter gummosus]|uniref:hypothetical protein n=1 Tax=Lysobacter gummosus TaxID=262324 RepID=UPI0036279711
MEIFDFERRGDGHRGRSSRVGMRSESFRSRIQCRARWSASDGWVRRPRLQRVVPGRAKAATPWRGAASGANDTETRVKRRCALRHALRGENR